MLSFGNSVLPLTLGIQNQQEQDIRVDEVSKCKVKFVTFELVCNSRRNEVQLFYAICSNL